jgi:hypothetical protein
VFCPGKGRETEKNSNTISNKGMRINKANEFFEYDLSRSI